MTLTTPALFSTQNSAIIPRGVYCSGLAKVFGIWTVQYGATARFVARQHDGDPGSDFFLPVVDNVQLFDVKESTTADQVIVFYATYYDVKYFIYNFSTRTLVSGPTTLTVGEAPALVRGPINTILLYERLKTMYARLGTGGTEKQLWSTAVQFVDEISAVEKATNPAFYRYHGVHSTRADASLPLRTDANSKFLFDCRDVAVNHYDDHSPNGYILTFDSACHAIENIGLVFLHDDSTSEISTLQLPNTQITIEIRIKPALSATISYLLTGAEMVLGFNHVGIGFWSYVAKGQTNTFVHEKLVGLRAKVDNYMALRHVFGDAASTAMVMNGTQIAGRWYGSFPAQVAGTGAITAFADVGGGIVRVTSNGHGMATGTWIRIYGTTNYNDVFQIANSQVNTFDITATWAGDDGAGTWDKTNNDHNLAGWTKPAFAVGDYNVALGHDDVLVMLSMNLVAKTVANLLEIARGRA